MGYGEVNPLVETCPEEKQQHCSDAMTNTAIMKKKTVLIDYRACDA
jgi:hypothetical protein